MHGHHMVREMFDVVPLQTTMFITLSALKTNLTKPAVNCCAELVSSFLPKPRSIDCSFHRVRTNDVPVVPITFLI